MLIGIFLVLLGLLAVGLPVVTTLSIAWLLGVGFIASGLAQLFHVFSREGARGRLSHFLLSALSMIAGIVVLRNPLVGAMAITLFVAFYFLASAVGRWLLLYEWGSFKGRGWLVFSSLISFVLGAYLIVNFPVYSLFIPGLFFGVDIVFYGFSLIAFGFTQKRIEHKLRDLDLDRAA